MPGERVNVYLTPEMQDNIDRMFNHLKREGEIPANADDPGDYRAQVLAHALECALDWLTADAEHRDELTSRVENLEVALDKFYQSASILKNGTTWADLGKNAQERVAYWATRKPKPKR